MITVACFLWSDPARKRSYTFTHEHVRILKSMVARNLSLPHRFVCITDETIESVETVPIDWTMHVPGTCFVKLMLWRPDIGELLGPRVFYMDLDCVVVGSLDPIVGRPEDVVLWRNPNFPAPGRAFYQTSFQLFTAGSRPELWNEFDPKETPKWVNRRFGGAEQAWLSERLNWQEAYWNQIDGIYGAGRLGDRQPGVQTTLPKNARLVSFPGNREPGQKDVQARHPWIRTHYH